jgi:hypothetical protein
MPEKHFLYRRRVIRFQMVDYEVIERPVAEHKVDIFEVLPADSPVRRVKQDGLLVEKQIGVVGNAYAVKRVNVFKEVEAMLVGADPIQIVCN